MVALRISFRELFSRGESARIRALMPGFLQSKGAPLLVSSVSASKFPCFFQTIVRFAGLSPKETRALVAKIFGIGGGGVALSFFMHSLVPLLVSFICLVTLYLTIARRAFRRTEGFERDYTALLLSLASSVKSGIDPLSALADAHKLFAEKSEMKGELRAFLALVESGRSEDDAVREFAATINHPDLPLFRSAFLLARKEGSSLAECLQRLARVTRQRQSFRRKIRAAVAMQKLSALGIVVCCLCIGLVQFVSNPAGFQKAIHQPAGAKLMVVGSTLMVLGIWWMMRITRSRI